MEEMNTEAIEESVPSEEVVQESGEVAQAPEIPIREARVDVNGQVMQINERQLKALWGLPENEPITDKEFKTMVSSYKAQKTSDIATRNARQQEKLVKEKFEGAESLNSVQDIQKSKIFELIDRIKKIKK